MDQIGKIKNKNKCDAVTEEIINLIVSKTLKPGERLPPENELVKMFGVSRVTLRESLKRLSTMGIVSIYQGDGSFVNSFNLKNYMKPLFSMMVLSELSLEQLYDARIYVEAGTASMAAKNRKTEHIVQLRQILVQQEKAIKAQDNQGFTELDWKFHLIIGEAADNEVLMSAYMMIKDILKFYLKATNRHLAVMQNSLRFHKEIVNAIEDQNCDSAESLMRNHITKAKQALLDMLREQEDGNTNE
nr:FadR/GntR family transcriptional regulator [uncultured Caproiciproducens sp.]